MRKLEKIKNFTDVFSEERHHVFNKLDKLHEFLKKLKYEGKRYRQSNIRTIERILSTLKETYLTHKQIDEEIIFPFLERHIPRLDPVLSLLTVECTEFYNIVSDCEALLKEFHKSEKQEAQMNALDRLSEKGIYAIVLIRNHIQMEIESVYKVIDKELSQSEKKQLIEALKKKYGKRINAFLALSAFGQKV